MASIRKLIKFLKPYWHWALLAPALMVLEVTMDLLQPRLIQRIIDEGIAQLDTALVIRLGLMMIGYALIGGVGGIGCTIFTEKTAQAFAADVRSALFRKVQSLSFGNLDKLETGNLITRLTNDVTQVQQVVSTMLRMMIRAPMLLIGSLIMAILTSPRLAILLLILSPLVFGVVVWVIVKAYPMFLRVQKRLDEVNVVMQENLAGVRVVKAFARAVHEIRRFGQANNNLMNQIIEAIRTMSVTMPAMFTAINLGVVGAIWFGGRQIVAGTMYTGQVIAFINYLMQALMSLMSVSMMVTFLARSQASADRIMEVLESKPEIQDLPNAVTPQATRGRVAFDQVTFSYKGNGHQDAVLKGLNFAAEPGQTVAILGATGSGKSSLVHLIPRFYDVTDGRVTIDGVDVRDMDNEALRRTIGIALQESVLFSGTIRDNIRYGRPDATDEEVIAAAKAAQAHDFIIEFPDGYDTLVGQRGVNFSGGQKQRIAIARALLTRPAVLILDDSTSSVDVETEIEIQNALEELMRDRTSFVIAQRISTVLNADKILVLDDGKIAAEGTHRDLLAYSPIYHEIYESQLGNGAMSNVRA